MERKFRRLTTEEPQGNVQWMHNMTVVKSNEVYLRDHMSEGDLSLVDYCRKECKEKCGRDINAGALEFGEYMDCDCIVAQFYWMAVGHAELRNYLKVYEETGLNPDEVTKQQELNRELVQFLKDFESVEADMLLDDEVWSTSDGLPKWNQRTYDKFMELQTKRNELVKKAKGVE